MIEGTESSSDHNEYWDELGLKSITTTHPIVKWISVKDRLPDKDGIYIVCAKCIDGDACTVLYYTKIFGFGEFPVNHWMPLPEPPKDNV